ncbi:MAG: CoA-binding protein [Gemmatimonadota bacterium]
MPKTPDAVQDFLAQKHIVVAGVSRTSSQPANAIYRRLRDAGYQVTAVNPAATEVEGDPCYPDLASVPGTVDGVMMATAPEATFAVARECVELGIPRVWMHRSFGEGSVSDQAAELCRSRGMSVIVGGCPMMFVEPVDVFHACMRWVLGIRGRIEA